MILVTVPGRIKSSCTTATKNRRRRWPSITVYTWRRLLGKSGNARKSELLCLQVICVSNHEERASRFHVGGGSVGYKICLQHCKPCCAVGTRYTMRRFLALLRSWRKVWDTCVRARELAWRKSKRNLVMPRRWDYFMRVLKPLALRSLPLFQNKVVDSRSVRTLDGFFACLINLGRHERITRFEG